MATGHRTGIESTTGRLPVPDYLTACFNWRPIYGADKLVLEQNHALSGLQYRVWLAKATILCCISAAAKAVGN
ncbi:MAG: hypothetical protein Q8904_00920 [Bacteroidota bacterium]|nr:hypothetical protein [Bacteroidota bacterium]